MNKQNAHEIESDVNPQTAQELVDQYKSTMIREAELEVMGATGESDLPIIAEAYQRLVGAPITESLGFYDNTEY